MSPWALWLCVILLFGSCVASDVPFVFDETASGVAGYTSDKIEKISTSSSDLAGVPQADTPSNDEILEFPTTGGGGSPGDKTETKVDELNRTINSKVEPDNDVVYSMAHQLAALHNGDFTIDQVDEIYSYLKYGNDSIRAWSYSRDTRGVDKFNSASESLNYGNHAKCVGSGDCDDFAILIASLVESIGGTTRVIFARNSISGGHAYTEVYLGRLDDPNGNVEEIISWLKQNYDTDKIFTHIDTDTRDVWLNLDWGPDEKGNAHPGGPFFKGDKHYIISVRDRFAKATMKPPEKSNKPPKLLSLKSDKISPQEIGTDITWTAEAKDIENDQLQYRFFLNDDPMNKWQTDNEWIWKPTDFDVGENQIEVRVRDGKHSGPNGYDINKIVSFDVAEMKPKAPENHPPINPQASEQDQLLIVDDDGFANFKTVREAVATAKNGSIIYVEPGLYDEEIVLDKDLKLVMVTGEADYQGGRTYIVDDYGFANYSTIKDAIASASNGDRILIKPGNYNEDLLIDKYITLARLPGETDPVILKCNIQILDN
jgi:hypothetical protein